MIQLTDADALMLGAELIGFNARTMTDREWDSLCPGDSVYWAALADNRRVVGVELVDIVMKPLAYAVRIRAHNVQSFMARSYAAVACTDTYPTQG